MGLFTSKNDQDNKNYSDGYDVGREGGTVADSLFRGFYGETWNEGYEKGQDDRVEHGSKDD